MAETFNDRLEKLANRRIDEAVQQKLEDMGHGGLKDYADYRYNAGFVAGLKAAKLMLDEALTECKKN